MVYILRWRMETATATFLLCPAFRRSIAHAWIKSVLKWACLYYSQGPVTSLIRARGNVVLVRRLSAPNTLSWILSRDPIATEAVKTVQK